MKCFVMFGLAALLLLGGCDSIEPPDQAATVLDSAIAQDTSCDETLTPDQVIQPVIDQARSGTTICLSAGIWQENLVIEKSLILRGESDDLSTVQLEGALEGYPVILISSDEVIEVRLENVTLSGSKGNECAERQPALICPSGIELAGNATATLERVQITGNRDGLLIIQSAQATLNNSDVSDNSQFGMVLWDAAHVNLDQVSVSDNGRAGLGVHRFSSLSMVNATVSGNNGDGVRVVGNSRVEAMDSTFSHNAASGILVGSGSSIVDLTRSVISNNETGIIVETASQLDLYHSTVSNNALSGVVVRYGKAEVELFKSAIEGNGTHASCLKPSTVCSGLEVSSEVQVTVEDSVLSQNADWGISAQLRECGFMFNDFEGEVVFEGENQIESNNTSGNQAQQNTRSQPNQVCLSN